MREHAVERRHIVILGGAFEGSLLLLAWGIGSFLGISLWQQFEWTWQGAGLGILATVPLLAALSFIYPSSWPLFRELRRLLDEAVLPLFTNCTLLDLAVISGLAGVGEEALFRGVMQVYLTDRIGVVGAVVATAIVFGLCHAISLTYALYAAVMGVGLGWLLVVSDNLLVPVLVHALYDFVALTFLVHLPSQAGSSQGQGRSA